MGANRSAWREPLSLDDLGAVAELRRALSTAGFDAESVREALGAEGGQVLVRADEGPLLRRRVAGYGPLGLLIGLFILDLPVPVADVRAALAPITVADLERLGLVRSAGGRVWTEVRIVPHGDLVIVSDRSGSGEADPDHVAGLHNASGMLADLTIRRPVGSALDLGTGSGIQAISARLHSGRVVATDVNPRALNFAAFNALLNGAEEIELREGSFFEPVTGERFDLIVSNPPFVISPESAYLFRDSGLDGDTVSRQLVQGAPALLTEGGYATVLVSWAQSAGEEWSAPLRRWVAGSGCDALLLLSSTQDPLTHAGNWTRERWSGDPAGFDAALARWLDYLARLGIDGVSYGAVVLRRREAGQNWVLEQPLPPAGLRPAGAHILRIFEAQDFLARHEGEEALGGQRFALTSAACVEQQVLLREGRWLVDSIRVRLEEGLRFEASIDPQTARFLAALDGTRTLAEVAAQLADAERAAEAVIRGAVPVLRGMLELGFVEPLRG